MRYRHWTTFGLVYTGFVIPRPIDVGMEGAALNGGARSQPHHRKDSCLWLAGAFCLAAMGAGVWAQESAELAEPVLPDGTPLPLEVSAGTRDTPSANKKGDFLDPEATNASAEGVNTPQPAADNKAPAEKKSEAEKKPEDKKAEEKKPEGKTEAAGDKAQAEQVPPAPVPSAEELAKRRARAADLQSLGEKFFKFPVTGSLYTRYRFRNGAGDHDQEIYDFLSMDFGDKGRQPITGHFDARAAADLDGRHTGAKADVFSGLVDTYNQPITAKLYSAYADFNRVPGLEFLRAGRQFNYDVSEVVQFDGLRLDTKPWFAEHETVFSVYGGLPVHQDQGSPRGDDLVGASVEGKPWKSMRMRLDYIHVDDNLSGERFNFQQAAFFGLDTGNGYRHNDLLSLSAWQTFHKPDLRLQGRFSVLDGEPRDALARVAYNKSEDQLQVSATYRAWFERQGRLATEFDTFFDTLAGQEPYHHGSLVVTKGWNEYFWMEAGAWVRRLLNDSNTAAFNREFERYYSTFQIRDLPIKGFTYGVTGSWWEGHGQTPDTGQVGGDVTYSWKKEFQSSIGTDYALYKYDLFTNTEHDRVRTYYVKQRWRPKRWATLDVNFEHERARSDTFNTLTVSFRFTF